MVIKSQYGPDSVQYYFKQMQPKLVINKGSRKFGVVNPRVKSCVDISRKVSSLTLKLLANGVADDLVPVDLGPGDRELPS